MQLAAGGVRLGVIHKTVGVGQLFAADQRKPVHRTFSPLGQGHMQVVARELRPRRHAHRLVIGVAPHGHRTVGDVKRLQSIALHANMGDLRLVGQHQLGDRINEVGLTGCVLQRDIVFNQRHAATSFGQHQATRVAHGIRLGGHKQQMHRRGQGHMARHHQHRYVLQIGRIERGKHVVAQRHLAAQVGLQGGGMGRQGGL